jgi:oligoendopeptidase F
MSTTTTTTGAEEVAWDLSDLYEGVDDPKLDEDMARARDETRAYMERYRGRLGELDAAELAQAMLELDDLEADRLRLGSYAYMMFSTDTADPPRGALLQRAEEWSAGLETDLLFFRLEWAVVDDARAEELLGDPRLAEFAHFLRAVRRFRPHMLSEPEERILTEKAVSGQAAWGRLFSELTSGLRVEIDGEDVALEEGMARLYSPEREVRRAAADAITEGLRPGLRTRSFVFNTLLLDKSIDDRLREYPHWLAARNLGNEASDESVQALVDAVVSRYDIPQRYYALKARLLDLDRLAFYDRLAPVSQDTAQVGWDDARDLVVEAYTEFSDEAGRIVADFFERRWIDAPIRANKRPGAYCMTRVPDVHPYVLMNYTGDRRSVLTLAHELGHGLHGYLAQERGALNAETPLTVAETASVFGEALTFDRLVSGEEDPSRRLDLVIGRLDDAVATIFRQIAMNRFEDTVHKARREDGELAPERFGEAWLDSQRAMLGEAVDLEGGYDVWWSYVPHYVVAPGYVYAYTFGYLFSLAIFRAWQREGDALVQPYFDVLRAGGSRAPEELAEVVGLDLRSDRIWYDGLEAVDELMSQAEALAAAR